MGSGQVGEIDTSDRRPIDRDVVDLCRQLIIFDTSNPAGSEAAAAEFVADELSALGLEVTRVEPKPGRTSLVTRVQGTDPSRPALLVHGHLDVVPVDESGWTTDPFGGEIRDGCLWGRGAVDMKDMLAMVLAAVREWGRSGRRPRRDLVLAFLADEEAGGSLGAGYLTHERPDLFAGCTEAVGEVGGFSQPVGKRARAYFVETSQKGVAWLRLVASSRGGHASMLHPDNPVLAVASAMTALNGASRFAPTSVATRSIAQLADLAGQEVDATDEGSVNAFFESLGPISRMLKASVRHTFNATMCSAGWKENVVPSGATALIDARFLPGLEEQFKEAVSDVLVGTGVDHSFEKWLPALLEPADTSFVSEIERALRTEDPEAVTVPYVLSAGSDAKWFTDLGISCFGFIPLCLPSGFDFSSQFHAPDERVPLDALTFGAHVMEELMATA